MNETAHLNSAPIEDSFNTDNNSNADRFNQGAEDNNEKTKNDYRSDGERRFYEISGFSREHHVSPQLESLFGMLSDDPDRTGFDVPKHNNATFTSLGLEYDGVRHPYNLEHRNRIHLSVVRDAIKDAHNKEEAIEKFRKDNDSWQEELFELIRKNALRSLTDKYNAKKNSLKKKQEALKSMDPGYALETATQAELDEQSAKIHATIVESNAMTKEELAEFDRFDEEKNAMFDYFRGPLAEHHFNKLITKATNDGKKLSENDKNDLERRANAFGEKQADCILKFVKATNRRKAKELENFPDQSELERPKLIAKQLRREASLYQDTVNHTAIEYKKSLTDMIKKEYGGSLEGKEIIRSLRAFFEKTENYYNELFPRYREFANRTEFAHYEEINDIGVKIKELASDHRANDSEKAIAESTARIAKFKNDISTIAFQKTEKPDDVFFYTTGIVALFDGKPYLNSISPLDERVKDQLEDSSERLQWTRNWSKHVSDHDENTRELINTIIQNSKEDPHDDFGKRTHAILDKYSIVTPRVFNPENGEIYDSLQPEDLDLLEEVLPYVGDFIRGVTIDRGDSDISLKSTRLEVVGYLAGSRSINSMQLYDDNLNLKVRTAECLYHNAGAEKSGKALNRLITETAVVLHEKLSHRQREEFDQIIGSYADISPAEFYRFFHRQIVDSKERHQVVLRSFFVKGFLDYAEDKADPAVGKFIDSLKKLRSLG